MVPDPALQDVHVIGPVEVEPVFVMFPDPAFSDVHVAAPRLDQLVIVAVFPVKLVTVVVPVTELELVRFVVAKDVQSMSPALTSVQSRSMQSTLPVVTMFPEPAFNEVQDTSWQVVCEETLRVEVTVFVVVVKELVSVEFVTVKLSTVMSEGIGVTAVTASSSVPFQTKTCPGTQADL